MNIRFTVSVKKKDGSQALSVKGENELFAFYNKIYEEGDRIEIEPSDKNFFAIVQIDQALQPSFVYCTGAFSFPIPFEEKKRCYPQQSFSGEGHYIYIRKARPEEIGVRKNLALNPCDWHENATFFPHASANVETRGESIFFARNAIDGCIANDHHGSWPFASWGINRDPSAELRIDFGREVCADELVFYLRADFPHDAWWKSGTVHFSDGSSYVAEFIKTGSAQRFKIEKRVISWLTFGSLIKADDPSPFPALTQLEVFGTEAN
ncbi:carbohydrate-binding protein [Treponema parvum]|uniref:carbohydrate-binding protein n=1 Tax=Treponema parvum TaxID=138851 RepID=UPI001AEC5E72|nr:carbohydrate-binding protein [Treponema parvum]